MSRTDPNAAGPSAGDERPGTATYWYDFICPYCYIAEMRNDILRAVGVGILARPYRAHPEIPPEGISMGGRSGPMYDRLEAEARRCGLVLRWPERLPDSAASLGVAEWVRTNYRHAAVALRKRLFAAHFAHGQDIGDLGLIEDLAARAGADPSALRAAIAEGATDTALATSELEGRAAGVVGTPTWLIRGQLIVGLHSADAFARMATMLRSSGS